MAAARRGTSVSALVARQLTGLASEDERYESARRRAIALRNTRRGTAAGTGRGTISRRSDSSCMAAERAFVDTNALLYACDSGEPAKQPIAMAVLERLWMHR